MRLCIIGFILTKTELILYNHYFALIKLTKNNFLMAFIININCMFMLHMTSINRNLKWWLVISVIIYAWMLITRVVISLERVCITFRLTSVTIDFTSILRSLCFSFVKRYISIEKFQKKYQNLISFNNPYRITWNSVKFQNLKMFYL